MERLPGQRLASGREGVSPLSREGCLGRSGQVLRIFWSVLQAGEKRQSPSFAGIAVQLSGISVLAEEVPILRMGRNPETDHTGRHLGHCLKGKLTFYLEPGEPDWKWVVLNLTFY